MAANIPDMGAISNLGSQFQHNVFQAAQKHIGTAVKKYSAAQTTQARQTQQNRNRYAQSTVSTINAGRAAYAAGQANQQKQAAQQAKTMQQQRNYAHGQAIQMQNRMNRQSTTRTSSSSSTAPATTPSATPSFSNAPSTSIPLSRPAGVPAMTFSSQLAPQSSTGIRQGSATATFSSASGGSHSAAPAPSAPRSGSVTDPQFPQHTHPEGSSTQPLPHLTASQPRPNTFTVGSRNARPGGIAARGSQLEAWAMGRQQQVRQQRQSGE